MRIVIQRAFSAQVVVDEQVVGRLPRPGLVLLVGITHDDTPADAAALAAKAWGLRILAGETSASDTSAPILAISQFTLYANARRGRRPSWSAAAPAAVSEPLFNAFVDELRRLGAHVETGVFGADMQVHLVNDGPVTVVLDSAELAGPRRGHHPPGQ
ncbi:D-aminoacyl-tRNA deacylase [Propionibacteriaceae bacterium Y1923]